MLREIEAIDLVRKYSGRFTLRVSLKLETGPVYVLLGPNGSGKSTLLRVLSLLERPDSGMVVLRNGGQHLNPFSDIRLRRRIVLVGTHPVVFNTTVIDNVLYGLRLRGMNKTRAMERAEEALALVGLLDKKDHRAVLLSSGQKQRLCLARAIAIEPDVLFLDEPTVNLDPANTKIIEDAIRRFNQEGQRIVLFVTHNIFQARKLGRRIVFMNDGRVLEVGEKEEFFRQPKTLEAKKFIEGNIY